MEQKITKEKCKNLNEMKKFNELKNENELKFNVKNVSLMKKQLFSLMMAFALVMGLSVGAWAQLADGLTPGTARSQAVGSVHSYTIDNGTTYSWAVYDATVGHTVGQGIEAAVFEAAAGISYRFSPDMSGGAGGASDNAIAYVQWLATPALGIYVIEGTANGASCSTVRRFYVSVFDFDIEVFLSDILGAGTKATEAADTRCNSWGGDVVVNTVSGVDIAGMNTATINNPSDNEGKYTDYYFKVVNTYTGLTAQTDVDDIKWKFQIDMPAVSGMSIMSIETMALSEGAVTFGAPSLATGTLNLIGGTTTAEETDITDGTNNWVYVASADANADNKIELLIRVRMHNRGGAADMISNIQASNAALEIVGADDTAYNDGLEVTDLTNNLSQTVTIQQSPATSVIVIGD